jgi:hypothetical protein
MTGYTNADGSSLTGALNPSNVGQALQVDGSGNLKVTGGGGGGGGGIVNLADYTTPANKATVDASGNIQAKLAAGTALAGGVNLVDSGGTNKAAVDASGNIQAKLAAGTALVGGANIVDSGGVNKLAIDSSGRLTIVPNQSINLSQWSGATPSASNPVITQDVVRYWLNNGQGYTATTGKQTAAGAITGGLSVFNTVASGKTLLVYSLTFIIGNNSFNQITFTTTDPALGTSAIVSNNKSGAAASVTSCSYANTNLTPAGSTKDYTGAGSNTFVQVLTNANAYILPSGSGIVFYSNLSGANAWLCSMSWIEI